VGGIWRVIGLILLAVFTVGGYLFADVLLKSGVLAQLSPQLAGIGGPLPIKINEAISLPGHILLRVGITLFLDVLLYAVMVIVWAIINSPKEEIEDPWRPGSRQ
jgi:hypothetical protein